MLGAALLVWTATAGAAALGDDAPGAAAPFYLNSFDKTPSAAALTALGRALFFDPPCRPPDHSLARAVTILRMRCVADRQRRPARRRRSTGNPVVRAVPSLMYEQNMPPFTEHFFDTDAETTASIRDPPAGTLWDGRAQSAHEQARLPLLSAFEMANSIPDAVVVKVARCPMPRSFAAPSGRACSTIAAHLQGRAARPRDVRGVARRLLSLLEQVRCLPARYGLAQRGRAPRPRGLQRSRARRLRALPPERNARGRISAIHGLRFRRARGAAQSGDCGECRPTLLRPRPMRSAAQGPCGTSGILRTVSHADACATSRANACFCTTAYSIRSRMWCASTPSAIRLPKSGIRGPRADVPMKFDDLPPEYRGNVEQAPPFGGYAGEAPAAER